MHGLIPALALATTIWSVSAIADSSAFIVGVCGNIRDGNSVFSLIKSVGAQSTRFDVPWAQVETQPGVYQIPAWVDKSVTTALSQGLQPILVLAYANPAYGGDKPTSKEAIAGFTNYARWVVSHYKGQIHYYELENEWDAHTGNTTPGSPDDYLALAKSVYPAIKAVDPSIVVLSGGISDFGLRAGWMDHFISQGGLKFVDAISIHPYNWNSPSGRTPEASMQLIDNVSKLASAANSGHDFPIYVTEIGYPTHNGKYGSSPDEAAWFVERFMLLAASRPNVMGVWWYNIKDTGTDITNKEHNFGLFNNGLQPKPAADAFHQVAQLLANGRPVIQAQGSQMKAVTRDASQKPIAVVWKADGQWSNDAGDAPLKKLAPLSGQSGTSADAAGAPRVQKN